MKPSQVTLLTAISMLAAPLQGWTQEPTIEIVEPWEEAVYLAPASISFEVSVFVPDTFVESVDVFANGTRIGSAAYCPDEVDCAAPNLSRRNSYEFFFDEAQNEGPWSDVPRGRYELVARGIDPRDGQVFESAPVSINVWTERPSELWIDLLEVEHDQIFQADERIPLEFLAVLPEGLLSHAAVFDNGSRIGYLAGCPPNAFCGKRAPQAMVSTSLTFYQNGGLIEDFGYLKGARPGAHDITLKGFYRKGIAFETEPFSFIVTEAPLREEPNFVLPVPNALYQQGDKIPIDVRLRVPPEGLSTIFIAANGERIGYVDYCPPNADCGGPDVGDVVHLEFYHDQANDLDDWNYWTNAPIGQHELVIMIEDPDTGVVRTGETISINVQAPNAPPLLTLARDESGEVSLQASTTAAVYELQASSDLIEWQSLGLASKETIEKMETTSGPMRFFRLR